ncbi:DNA-formamidopyrimidine glycosylase family protein [Cellulomonas dongxiuzhuiae]|uniref:DNA-(apurinic or apyrimidinic site) lyase n=1 Tax=Cellulomonas dongxiuzhuiae TaxID=2819979 RepID=A0ABX8GPH3_9CELL|nr:DNA-formamidopyrimidine glycosylase family protein [Cellulomonas dongxiuzhuiae]MBO3087502.1 Fpg/Nei family DNA glycosylase [Cellulomonas dongxiuzhuiae]MBO3096139.1 Fpg/Nei family DNA glycosylase [Cellulomonas dongxiuzhuiae]QWC17406.1 Fpg/Nei family DNA glycosylase [Cellulomonas dongxiuzhuiae]
MPEGDVLRRTAAHLDRALAGRRLVRADLRWPTAATVDLRGRTVLGTRPYGKHLLTRFDDGRTLHTHLRMDGTWRLVPSTQQRAAARSPQVRAVLGDERWTAVGYQLGMLDVVPTSAERALLGHLGPDVLDGDFDTTPGVPWAGPPVLDLPTPGIDEALRRWSAQGARPVAEVLLDQRVVVGIGTIFTAESLFARGWWPWAPADAVTDADEVLRAARALLRASVATGRPEAAVYGREGRTCSRCGARVARGDVGAPPTQRQVYWCPGCQVRGRV